VPFSDAAWAVVEPLWAKADEAKRDHLLVSVVKSHGDKPIANYSGLKDEIDKAATTAAGKALAPWTFHDLRRTLRSGLPPLGVPENVCELVLGHTKKGIVAKYDHHKYRAEKRAALDRWAAHVNGLGKPPGAGNVRDLEAERARRSGAVGAQP